MLVRALALVFLAASPLAGQSFVAVDAGATTFGDEPYKLFDAGVRLGSLRPKRVNADARIGTFPQALVGGFVVLTTDIDAAYVLPLGKEVAATPRGGFSLLAGLGGEGGGGALGWNFGLGIVAGLTQPVGVRFDYTHRTYLDMGEGAGSSTFSIGIVWLHHKT